MKKKSVIKESSIVVCLFSVSLLALMSCSKDPIKSLRTGGKVTLDQSSSEDASPALTFLEHSGMNFILLEGTPGPDTLDGTEQSDNIRGLDGDDTIRGLAGPDYINGNQGNDNINGNQGNDVVHGGMGDDTVYGGADNDWVYGDKGNDQVFGNKGDDHLLGMEGDDFLDGGEGNDTYYFKIGDGNDRINDTGGGTDRIVCLGFARGSAKIGQQGDTMSISYPTGDSLIIENKSTIESIECSGSNSDFVDNSAPDNQMPGADTPNPASTTPSDGDDVIDGSAGNDVISAQSGNDTVRGLDGNDIINGNQGNDILNGNQGDDLVLGGQGDDHVMGGQGDDYVMGNLGNDKLEGNLGNDVLNGNEGNDTLDGGEGNDTYHFVLGSGSDIFDDTGGGVDTVVCLGFDFMTGSMTRSGNDTIIRYSSGDMITLKNSANFENIHCAFLPSGLTDLDGTAGDDTLDGTAGRDSIRGLDGNDTLRGLDGEDVINGNQGNDNINGNQGNDYLAGGMGDDTVMGGQGNDYVTGSLGNDRIEGNFGNDILVGGEGSDNLDGGADNDVYLVLPGHGTTTVDDTGGGTDSLHCANFNARAQRSESGGTLTLNYPTGERIIIRNRTNIESIACP